MVPKGTHTMKLKEDIRMASVPRAQLLCLLLSLDCDSNVLSPVTYVFSVVSAPYAPILLCSINGSHLLMKLLGNCLFLWLAFTLISFSLLNSPHHFLIELGLTFQLADKVKKGEICVMPLYSDLYSWERGFGSNDSGHRLWWQNVPGQERWSPWIVES